MWLSLCGLALVLWGTEAFNITQARRNALFNITQGKRNALFNITLDKRVDPAANVDKAARFVGIAYHLLRADPDAANNGGVDPGFLTMRRVVDESAEKQSFPRDSCVTQSSTSTIYDEKSFQKKFDLDVAVEAGVSTALAEAKFAMSTSFSEAKDQTTKEKKMTMETQTLCNLGGSRLKTELHTHRASQSFRAAVCQLPEAYNQADYVKFIDDWGTNYVVQVTVGIRDVSRKTETFSSVYESLQEQFGLSTSASASYSGAIVSVSGSIEMNMNKVDNSQQLKESFKGTALTKTIGTRNYPEPIQVKVGALEDLIETRYFPTPNPSQCTTAILGKLAARKANLARALSEYPAAKRAMVAASTGTVRIPLTWPRGTYGLHKSRSSCPSGWSTGSRFWDTEDDDNINGKSNPNSFDGTVGHNIEQKFCIKTNPWGQTKWPVGEYCIYKYRNCPEGFTAGSVYWDDEDDDNINKYSGRVPDGTYNGNTKMFFCCRKDGYPSTEILLPTDRPFYLFQADRYGCQKVAGMNYRVDWIMWDCEDDDNSNSVTSVGRPHMETGRNYKIYYCYYTKR